MARTLSDLVRTMQTFFRFGTLRLKDSSGKLHVRNGADSAFAGARASLVDLTDGTNVIALKPGTPAATYDIVLPDDVGSTNEVLAIASVVGSVVSTDWVTVATASNQVLEQSETVAYNTSSPIAVFTPPANATIRRITIEVETAFDATGPSMSVGVAGSTSRYMGTTDVDLATVGIYEVDAMYEEDGTPDAVIITFSAGSGGAAGAARVTIQYSNPS